MNILKRYDFTTIKYKLYFLFILNVTDILFTKFLLNTGLFIEGNSIMKNVIDNTLISFSLKTVVPALLVVYLCWRLKKANEKQMIRANKFVNFAVITYILINCSHLVWTGLYIYTLC